MKKLLTLILAAPLLLSGCALYTPSGGAVVIDPHGSMSRPAPAPSGGSGGGNFCPPGQAKKGNC